MRWDDSIYPAATVERIATVQEINEKKVEIYMSNKDGAKKKPKVKRQSSDAGSYSSMILAKDQSLTIVYSES